MDNALTFNAANYGWAFVLVIILLREIAPLLIKVAVPSLSERKTRKEEAAIIADTEDRRHRQRMEERSVLALEKVADLTDQNRQAIEAIRVYMETSNARLERLEIAMDQTGKAIAILLERHGESNDETSTPTRRRRSSSNRPN